LKENKNTRIKPLDEIASDIYTMKTIKRISTLQKYLQEERRKKKSIGFVPTMGALHEGHLSLAQSCQNECDICVVSIFVNPTQFNQKDDLLKYPRQISVDQALIRKDCDYLFLPSVNQIYPKKLDTSVELDISHLTASMEGPNRPGHFDGVVQVLKRFIDIMEPDYIYMGQKDFQQFSIVDYMLKKLNLKTSLRVCPTIREADGLAMSSRNLRLDPAIRQSASVIYKALNYAKEKLGQIKPEKIEAQAIQMMSITDFKPEYFEIVDGYSMERVKVPEDHDLIVACTASWAGKVRLIDNLILKGEEKLFSDKIRD